MAKNAVNYTGLIPETGDSFESATQNTTGSLEGIDTKIGTIDNNITDINNEVDTIDTSLSGHISNTSNPHSVTKSQIGLGNAEDTSDLTKMTVVTFSDLDTTNKTIIGAINETIVTDSTTNGNIKIAGAENTVYTHPNHSGDVVSTGDGITIIQSNIVGNSKLAQMPTMTIKGNDTGGTANAKDLTKAEVQTFIQDPNNRMVSDSKIAQWDSTNAVIKYYGTQTLAIADETNLSLGNYIQTFGTTTINDGGGSLYIIENSLVNGFSIGNGKYANYLVNSTKTQASGDNSTKVANTAFVTGQDLGMGQSYQNVTSQRAINTVHTNTTGKPIQVFICCKNTATTFYAQFNIQGIGHIFGGDSDGTITINGGFVGGTFIVPPGVDYSLVGSNVTKVLWSEMR